MFLRVHGLPGARQGTQGRYHNLEQGSEVARLGFAGTWGDFSAGGLRGPPGTLVEGAQSTALVPEGSDYGRDHQLEQKYAAGTGSAHVGGPCPEKQPHSLVRSMMHTCSAQRRTVW